VIQYYANVAEATNRAVSSDSDKGWSSSKKANTGKRIVHEYRGLVGALLPVFFVLALGYLAGKRQCVRCGPSCGAEQARA